MPSVYNFVDGSPYILNQLFGYQDAEESRQRPLRLRDALALQHRWVNSGTSTPDIGTHYGNIGDVATPSNTVYYGDGSNLINVNKGGWADLTRVGTVTVGGGYLAGNGNASQRIANATFQWGTDYGTNMLCGVWYDNQPPSSWNSTEAAQMCHRFARLQGTFKLGIVSGVIAGFAGAYQPINASSYMEFVPYLRNVDGGAAINTSSSPVRLYFSYPEGFTNSFGAFKTVWQFTNVPAHNYYIFWKTYCNNIGYTNGPRLLFHVGLSWDMMTRTPYGYSSYFFGWNAQILTWYPVAGRPYGGHSVFANSPMWTED